MVLWFQWSSLDHAYLRLSHSETVVGSLKLACVINHREGGYKMVKSFCAPPSRQGKTFRTPLLKSRNFLPPVSIWLNFKLPRKNSRSFNTLSRVRDWSLITGRGGLQMEKIAGLKLFASPPSRQGKSFRPPPLLKSGNFFVPPFQYG